MNRVILSKEDAIKMLPDGDVIHSFKQSGSMIIGCDYTKEKAIGLINSMEVEISGPTATNMGHGLCLNRTLFLETRK